MGQIRLYYQTDKNTAEKFYPAIEQAFEEDGYSLALSEIDEDKQIFEISIYIEETEKEAVLSQFASILQLAPAKIDCEVLPDIDWVSHSLAELTPVQAGRFFVHGSHDRDKIKADDIAIEIDAGLAFGTGHHGTTSGCLEMIQDVLEHNQPTNVLDLGTGSGVLAIGVALLRPITILATDIDEVAVNVAKENFALNGVADKIEALTASGFDHEAIKKRAPFDLIIANILANPLIELAPQMVKALAKNGIIILSGILKEQHDRVLHAYQQQGLTHIKTFHRSGWVTIHLQSV